MEEEKKDDFIPHSSLEEKQPYFMGSKKYSSFIMLYNSTNVSVASNDTLIYS